MYFGNNPMTAFAGFESGVGKTDGLGGTGEIFNNYTANKASGYCSHAHGTNAKAMGDYSHADGFFTTANGECSSAHGDSSIASGRAATAQGCYTKATGVGANSQGFWTGAHGNYSFAQGFETKANGNNSVALGKQTTAANYHTVAEGWGTIASAECSHAQGKFNIEDTAQKYLHIVGKGANASSRSNAHTIDTAGNAWFGGSVTSTGADYAEMFEWEDGNPDKQDRVGLLVTLDGAKIKLAQSADDFVLGIVSSTPAIIGDNQECEWQGKYLKDDFGRVQYQQVERYEETQVLNEETGELETKTELIVESVPVINPEYDPNKEYIARGDRPEWDCVGMLGKLYVYDDGSCEVNKYVAPSANGVATLSAEKTNIRVMERVAENIILVLMK